MNEWMKWYNFVYMERTLMEKLCLVVHGLVEGFLGDESSNVLPGISA